MFITTCSLSLAAMIFATAKPTGPSLSGATGWLNTQQLGLENLRGKVVLIDFWTYTCINWRRTLPYVREWASKYKEQGLVVIGVHTPEFSFEQKMDNVASSVKDMNINYPVALDNNFSIWNSFNNQYWPALYLIDAKGKIRYQKFGEGDYAESEMEIQKLLKEISSKNIPVDLVQPKPDGYETAADWEHLRSGENFLGYSRTAGFASPQEPAIEERGVYSAPKRMQLNQWALSGEWIMKKENVSLAKLPGSIVYKFHARDVHLIMGPAMQGATIKFRVLIDGRSPGASHGVDVDIDGNGKVTGQRMYQLIRQQGPISDHEFQIEFFDAEVEVFDFTFG